MPEQDTELAPMSAQEFEARYARPMPDPEETVRVIDALAVEAALEDLLAAQLVAAVNRATSRARAPTAPPPA